MEFFCISRSNYVSVAVKFTMFNKGDSIVTVLQRGGSPPPDTAGGGGSSNGSDP